jgi:hypothetical protein
MIDELYRDILEGLAVYWDSTLVRDLVGTLARHNEPRLGEALNRKQMASKRWLADALAETVGRELGNVVVLGGWFGVLGALLLNDARFAVTRVASIDIDPACAPIAESLNATHARVGRFRAVTADMLELDYARIPALDGGSADLVINTSCEHLPDYGRWHALLPAGQLVVLQSNDYTACAEHVNCVPNLAAFIAQAPLATTLFAGERKLPRYARFMLIGRR